MSDDRDDLSDRLDDLADELDSEPDIGITSTVTVVTQEDVDNGDDDGEVVTVTRNPTGGE